MGLGNGCFRTRKNQLHTQKGDTLFLVQKLISDDEIVTRLKHGFWYTSITVFFKYLSMTHHHFSNGYLDSAPTMVEVGS